MYEKCQRHLVVVIVKVPCQRHTVPPFILIVDSRLPRAPAGIPRPVNGPLDMSRDPLLAGVELRADNPVLAQRTPDLLAHLADGPARVEVLADSALRGDD